MRSGVNVRGAGDKYITYPYLILYHCIANILNQTTKLIRILGVVEKLLGLPLFCQ